MYVQLPAQEYNRGPDTYPSLAQVADLLVSSRPDSTVSPSLTPLATRTTAPPSRDQHEPPSAEAPQVDQETADAPGPKHGPPSFSPELSPIRDQLDRTDEVVTHGALFDGPRPTVPALRPAPAATAHASAEPAKGFMFRAPKKQSLLDVVISTRFLRHDKQGANPADAVARAWNVQHAYSNVLTFQNDVSDKHAFIYAPPSPNRQEYEDCIAMSYLLEHYKATIHDDATCGKVSHVFVHTAMVDTVLKSNALDVFRTIHGVKTPSFFVFGLDPKKSTNNVFYRIWDSGQYPPFFRCDLCRLNCLC
jgi:hypothetical protein